MTKEHPIALPSEGLVLQWSDEWYKAKVKHMNREKYMCMQAALWGADQELNACCEWIYKLMDRGLEWSMDLRADRRPKPPNLKEQALALINHDSENQPFLSEEGIAIIRRALESLPD